MRRKVLVRVYDGIVSPVTGAFLYLPLPLEGFKAIVASAQKDERSDIRFHFRLENIEMLEREADMKIPRHLVIDRQTDQEALLDRNEYQTGDMMIFLHNRGDIVEMVLGHYFDFRSARGVLAMLFQDYHSRKDPLDAPSLQEHIQGRINAIQHAFDNQQAHIRNTTKGAGEK